MLSIAWQYLTGRAVATDPVDRRRAEWPPHPDRVFQALVAAWGERGEAEDERVALEWLAGQPAPEVSAPLDAPEIGPESPAFRPEPVKVFVPVNDVEGPRRGAYGDTAIGLLPAARPRKERFFPGIVVGDAVCALRWPAANPAVEVRASLARVAAAVTYLGHSTSMVRMWLTEDPPRATWVPVEEAARRRDVALRVVDPERLGVLVRAYAGGGHAWRRPPTARWRGYLRNRDSSSTASGDFDDRLLVFRQVGGDRLCLPQTPALAEAFRATVLPHAAGPAREILSGHRTDGSPADGPHAAYLPLADVGHIHADGHLLGAAVALPDRLDVESEAACIAAIAAMLGSEDAGVTLVMGRIGAMQLIPDESPAPPVALRASTWSRSARDWATVTPIVLDRFPPRRHSDQEGWAAEVIADACCRQGLPRPLEVSILRAPAFVGAPPAHAFSPLLRKGDGARRWQVHATLHFGVAVRGPLLLGAGRYRGYGLCRPFFTEDRT